jgi:hypothetical protein
MKSPRDAYREKHGDAPATPDGGAARARQQQFEAERATAPALPASDAKPRKKRATRAKGRKP